MWRRSPPLERPVAVGVAAPLRAVRTVPRMTVENLRLTCECGYTAETDAIDALVAAAQDHARDAHDMKLSPAVIRRLVAGRTRARR